MSTRERRGASVELDLAGALETFESQLVPARLQLVSRWLPRAGCGHNLSTVAPGETNPMGPARTTRTTCTVIDRYLP